MISPPPCDVWPFLPAFLRQRWPEFSSCAPPSPASPPPPTISSGVAETVVLSPPRKAPKGSYLRQRGTTVRNAKEITKEQEKQREREGGGGYDELGCVVVSAIWRMAVEWTSSEACDGRRGVEGGVCKLHRGCGAKFHRYSSSCHNRHRAIHGIGSSLRSGSENQGPHRQPFVFTGMLWTITPQLPTCTWL